MLSLAGALLIMLFARISVRGERFVSVPLEVILRPAFVISAPHYGHVRVRISGEKTLVNTVLLEDITASADLTTHGQPGTFSIPVTIQRRGRALETEGLALSSEPMEVLISQETKVTRRLAVRPDFWGRPPPGYELSNYAIAPSAISVVGPESRMKDLTTISTEAIDLSERARNFSLRVRLLKPDPLVLLAGGETVEFKGSIQKVIIIRDYSDLPISVIDLASSLRITSPIPPIKILKVRGSKALLDRISTSDFRFTIDSSQIEEPGKYSLPVKLTSPEGVAILKYLPTEVGITIESASEDEEAAP